MLEMGEGGLSTTLFLRIPAHFNFFVAATRSTIDLTKAIIIQLKRPLRELYALKSCRELVDLHYRAPPACSQCSKDLSIFFCLMYASLNEFDICLLPRSVYEECGYVLP